MKNRELAGFLGQKYLRSSYSDVLLEITPIESADDIHFIVGRVKDRAQSILTRHLHYDDRAINGFIVALSEVCQNIIEHSENRGFVGIQKYHFKCLDKNVVKIAVMDIDIGFRKSLSDRFSIKDDMEAIEKSLLHGASRYADEGRGHGLAAVRRFVTDVPFKTSKLIDVQLSLIQLVTRRFCSFFLVVTTTPLLGIVVGSFTRVASNNC